MALSYSSFFLIFINSLYVRPLIVNCLQPYLHTEIDYASSSVDLVNLIKVESQLVLKLLDLIHRPSSTIDKLYELSSLKEYLEDFQTTFLGDLGLDLKLFSQLSTRSIIDFQGFAEDAAKHPFKTYRTIRRLIYLRKVLQDKNANTDISRQIEHHQKLQPFPKYDDLETASFSILRLNHLLKLPVENFLNGRLQHLKTSCNLSTKHLLEIGELALRNNFSSQAVDFLFTASTSLHGTADEVQETDGLLREAIEKHDRNILRGVHLDDIQPDSGPMFFHKLLYNSSHENFKNRIPVPFEVLLPGADLNSLELDGNPKIQALKSAYLFENLCRGEILQHSSQSSALRCYLTTKSHPTYVLKPLKVEVHNESPLIIQYYDVVSETEIKRLKNEVKREMRMSRTIKSTNDELGQTSRFRTSSNAWITDYRNPKFKYLSARISRILGVNATGLFSTENLQIAAYSPGGHYVPHTDAVFEDFLVEKLDPSEFLRGDRIITFMIYLSDVEIGGATAFPFLRTVVQPVKGSALAWYNLNSDGSIDRRTLHGGCSVVYGVKWIANKWIRANDQMFSRKCPMSKSPWGLDI